jgi:hypothetical protein
MMAGISKFLLVMTSMSIASVTSSYAATSCEGYPLNDGMAVDSTAKGPKIMSTVSVAVALDDNAEVLDAIREGELTAKAQIAEFLDQIVQSETALNVAVDTQIQIVGDRKTVTKDTIKTQLRAVRSHSSALLKGVIRLGDCYTKGRFVRVTIGLKPETVGVASDTETSIEDGGSTGLDGVDSFNNSKGITNF